MADLFNRNNVFGGAIAADATKISFSGAPSGLIVQQFQVDYQQTINRMYALEDGKIYFTVGGTNGTFTAKHAVGPNGLATAFYTSFSDACNPGTCTLGLNGGCGTTQAYGSLELEHVVLNRAVFSATVQDMTVYADLTAMFVAMTVSDASEDAAAA